MSDMFLMFFGNEDLGKRTFLFLVLLLRELSTYATMKHFNTFIPRRVTPTKNWTDLK